MCKIVLFSKTFERKNLRLLSNAMSSFLILGINAGGWKKIQKLTIGRGRLFGTLEYEIKEFIL